MLFRLALLASASLATSAEPAVPALDAAAMQKLVASNDKVVLLMHAEGCERGESFVPTLEKIAAEVPELAYGKITVGENSNSGLATRFKVERGAPSLRAMFRNAPPAMRMLEYAGPPTFEAVLEWCKSVHEWDGSATPPKGWEVGKRDDQEPPPKKKKKKEARRPSIREGQAQPERTEKDEV